MPPITELTRIEPVHLDRLEHQGVFTTGILLEVSETPTRRQTLADQVDGDDERRARLARRGADAQPRGLRPDGAPAAHAGGIEGLRDILGLDLDDFRDGSTGRAVELKVEPPTDLMTAGWWEQARTLEDA